MKAEVHSDTSNTALSIRHLYKSFGAIKAVQDLSFEVEKGQIFGILGPNGSGKSTTLSILLNCQRADNGAYTWNIGDEQRPLHSVGALLEQPNFFAHLTGIENLRWMQEIKDDQSSNLDDLLRRVELYERRNSKFSTYSSGMKQRLAVASALIGAPEFLVFDEPTNALDPEGIADIRQLITELGREGKTILMASHVLSEVEKVCSHCAILREGKLIASGAVDALLGKQNQFIIQSDQDGVEQLLDQWPAVQSRDKISDHSWNILVDDALSGADINRHFFEQGIVLDQIEEQKTSLEEQYLSLLQE